MALTKLPQNAFGTGSVDSDKIEDGTVQGVDISGSIANDRLVNSSITFSGSSTALGGSATLAGYLDWQSVITADGSTSTTAVAGKGYIVDTTSASHTINLPASASIGDTIGIKDYAGTFGTNALVIGRNGHNIQGVANNSQLGTNRASVVLVYVDSTKGWLYTNEHNVGELVPTYISASGGTETTDGNFKIHTFTGDGCFVVSSLGNPIGGPNNAEYLVVAGGGGGGFDNAGGGGAGGFRTNYPSPGTPITVQTYPITVGAGGAGRTGNRCGTGSPGSNSVFSSITSTGGGGGGSDANGPSGDGANGGSGGGGAKGGNSKTGGSGNTPPVSPSQGNPGGAGAPYPPSGGAGGGGGGGATQSGTAGPATSPAGGGPGGDGTANSITGSSVTRAGGGGGGSPCQGGSGGAGGGGDGASAGGFPNTKSDGTANTGGGGGGGTGSGDVGASGGKGIVVIRYKYQ